MTAWINVCRLGQRYRLRGDRGWQVALQDVSFSLQRGESLGLVGASGSGKSTLGRLLLGLEVPYRGEIMLAGRPLHVRPSFWHRAAMAGRVGAVFQDYHLSVNPVMRVAAIIAEPLYLARQRHPQHVDARVTALLAQVGLSRELGDRYPHQLSGGQMQRVCIARALASEPDFIVFDEAVSALDVMIQRQLLDLLSALQKRLGLTYLFISHDLSAVTYLCQRVLFLHQGRVIEHVKDMAALGQVRHPEARRLLTSVLTF